MGEGKKGWVRGNGLGEEEWVRRRRVDEGKEEWVRGSG